MTTGRNDSCALALIDLRHSSVSFSPFQFRMRTGIMASASPCRRAAGKAALKSREVRQQSDQEECVEPTEIRVGVRADEKTGEAHQQRNRNRRLVLEPPQ